MAHSLAGLALALGMALALPAIAGATEPSPEPQPAATVWLRGPFGTVAGDDPLTPATAAPDARALDTWMRAATLEVVVTPPLAEADSVTVSATAMEDGEVIELPLRERRWVSAPDRPGRHTVVATFEPEQGETSRHAWSLDVPDRPGSWETLLEKPALEASLTASAGSVVGLRGHGCYVDTCQEVGYRPPAASLDPLPVAVGEPLTLRLGDGSALVGWQGRAEPQPGTSGETRTARADLEEAVAGPALTGLEPDRPGEWLLEVRADFDRQRGWQWYLFRLIAE